MEGKTLESKKKSTKITAEMAKELVKGKGSYLTVEGKRHLEESLKNNKE
jgi:hypothetical protein